jgi:exopolysaccharide biosynthesis WecB/TagA/CpsF family protein
MHYESLFGIRYAITNYEEASQIIINKAMEGESYAVTALAVHGLIEGYRNTLLKSQINKIDLVVPDGQPIRWALNYFFNASLKDRVYGPTLMLNVLSAAEQNKIGVFLYGSTPSTIEKLTGFISRTYPGIVISGTQADRFRDSTNEEVAQDRKNIIKSGAQIVFVGRGCPRQEKWVAENKSFLPAVLIAVGAAFDFHAGNVKQAPGWVQDAGLEWLYRLVKEPGRLWKRYLFTNTYFIVLFFTTALKKVFKR